MGGSGSGRYTRFKAKRTVEEYLWIDAHEWCNRGILYEGSINVHWGWPNNTGIGRTQMKVSDDGDWVKVEYTINSVIGEPEAITQWIPIEFTPCHLGGIRWWFLCPQNTCERRVRRLYRGKRFFCRFCYGLNYQSQHMALFGRMTRKAQKIRVKLGGSANLLDLFPLKPKGMHYSTHEKLYRKSECARMASFLELEEGLKRMRGEKSG